VKIAQTDNADEQSRNEAFANAILTKEDGSRDLELLRTLGEALTNRTIRVLSINGGGSVFANVGIAVATLVLENETNAIMAGSVTKSGKLNVHSASNYPLTLAATLAVGGSLVNVGASASVVASTGRMESSIKGNGEIRNTGDISVTSASDTSALSFAATMGGGGVSVNAGVALAINRLVSNTFIGRGVTIETSASNIGVKSTSSTNALAGLLGFSAGGVAVLTNAAVAIVEPEIKTFVGDAGELDIGAGNGSITASKALLTISNTTISDASAQVMSLAAGGVAVGGNLLVLFALHAFKNFGT